MSKFRYMHQQVAAETDCSAIERVTMAVAAFYTWDRAGRPLSPAQPVVDVIARMKAAYPKAAASFSYFADASHYQAAVPQDHTPYSTDGWPVPCQQWWVYATDIMHNPGAGVDCNVLFPYWLAEARAGRFPGLKYLIWQAHIYDVRHGWQQQASAGHYDHIHLSFRTDWQTRGLGSWSLIPGGDDMSAEDVADIKARLARIEARLARIEAAIPAEPNHFMALFGRVLAVLENTPAVRWGPTAPGEVNELARTLARIEAASTKPVQVDASAVASALASDPTLLAAIAKAVNDDDHRRSES